MVQSETTKYTKKQTDTAEVKSAPRSALPQRTVLLIFSGLGMTLTVIPIVNLQ